jgi:hypothetical protein
MNMRLLIVGTLKGQLTTATKIAMDNGASVTHAEAARVPTCCWSTSPSTSATW